MATRKHLTESEVEQLISATAGHRNSVRDRCLLLLMYRHGLRVSEACGLTLSQVDLNGHVLHVSRLKQGLSTTHPLRRNEIRYLKSWLAIRGKQVPKVDALFISQHRTQLSRQTVHLLVRKYGKLAGLPLQVCPHMLRHACGYALANQGADTRLIQDYLGHKNIQHTVRYTAANSARFETLWR
jgi:type 1 fimbriae regulatory protein FimB